MENTDQREELECFVGTGGHQRRSRGSPFRIAATCLSIKYRIFGPKVQKRLVQAGRPVFWGLATRSLVAQMFQMPVQAIYVEVKGH